jgi:hypothetical protein
MKRWPEHHMLKSRFQNLVAAEVTRLKHSEDQSLLTSVATVLKEPREEADSQNPSTRPLPHLGGYHRGFENASELEWCRKSLHIQNSSK